MLKENKGRRKKEPDRVTTNDLQMLCRGLVKEEAGDMRILLVEDDEQIREVIMDYFENHAKQYVLECAEDGPKGLSMLRKERYDLLLLDVMLPGMSGFSILREIRKASSKAEDGTTAKGVYPAEGRNKKGLRSAEDISSKDIWSAEGIHTKGAQLTKQSCPNSSIPVIMITAKIREEDRLLGYELGCDDYVCKPFSIAELCAKVGAVLRRVNGMNGLYGIKGHDGMMGLRGERNETEREQCLKCNHIMINLRTHDVTADGKLVTLSPKEYELLLTFMEHPNWIFTREMLLDRIWGMDYEGTERTVDNHVKKLRKSLGTSGKQIKTVFRKGYKLEREEG